MVARVFLLLLISVAVICMDEEEVKYYNEPRCKDRGGICTAINNCKIFKPIGAHLCPEQVDLGAWCCVPYEWNRIADFRNNVCLDDCSQNCHDICSQEC